MTERLNRIESINSSARINPELYKPYNRGNNNQIITQEIIQLTTIQEQIIILTKIAVGNQLTLDIHLLLIIVTLTQAQDQTLRTLEVVVVLTTLVVDLGGQALVVEEINCL